MLSLQYLLESRPNISREIRKIKSEQIDLKQIKNKTISIYIVLKLTLVVINKEFDKIFSKYVFKL